MDQQDHHLCEACARLDLVTVFNPQRFSGLPDRRVPSQNDMLKADYQDSPAVSSGASAHWINDFQQIGRWMPRDAASSPVPKSPCPLCDLFSRIFKSGAPLGKEILSFQNELLYDAAADSGALPRSTHLMLLDPQILDMFNQVPSAKGRDIVRLLPGQPPYTVTTVSTTTPNPSDLGVAAHDTLLLREHPPNYKLISSWLTQCFTQHGDSCSPPARPVVSRLKLIDCRACRIINTSPEAHYKYVALSYVWGLGKPEPYSYPALPNPLPLVIQDAITLVLALGLQYLWVDRYCIWQDDTAGHKQSQIENMDRIYGDAHFTIVASAGADPIHGLPSVSRPRLKNFQLRTNVGPVTIVATSPCRRQEAIATSRWRTRGWTFQEEALSRRRLYLTDFEASYECRAMRCFEHLAAPLAFDTSSIENRPLEKNLEADTPQGIWGLVQNYSGRALTYHADKLLAITGVLNEWRRRYPDCFHFWGVPVLAAPECWRGGNSPEFDFLRVNNPGVGFDFLRGTFSFTRAFLGGLYMWSMPGAKVQVAKRDDSFPSWSWAGQGAEVMFDTKYQYSPIGVAKTTKYFDAKVWAVRRDGSRVEWERHWSQGGQDYSPMNWSPHLDIEGWVFKIGPFRKRQLRGKSSPTFWIPAFDEEEVEEAPVKWMQEVRPDPLWFESPVLLTNEFEAISFCPPAKADFALVLHTMGDVMERVGLLEIMAFTIVDKGSSEDFEYGYTGNGAFPAQKRRLTLG